MAALTDPQELQQAWAWGPGMLCVGGSLAGGLEAKQVQAGSPGASMQGVISQEAKQPPAREVSFVCCTSATLLGFLDLSQAWVGELLERTSGAGVFFRLKAH